MAEIRPEEVSAILREQLSQSRTEAELEGKKARAFPLRFVDGAVFLGPLKVAQVPPLF